MSHDDEEPPVEYSQIAWIKWYRRKTDLGLSECMQEYRIQLRLVYARRVHYHCTQSRRPHDPTKALIVAGENWPVVGQIYNELYQRLKA